MLWKRVKDMWCMERKICNEIKDCKAGIVSLYGEAEISRLDGKVKVCMKKGGWVVMAGTLHYEVGKTIAASLVVYCVKSRGVYTIVWDVHKHMEKREIYRIVKHAITTLKNNEIFNATELEKWIESISDLLSEKDYQNLKRLIG